MNLHPSKAASLENFANSIQSIRHDIAGIPLRNEIVGDGFVNEPDVLRQNLLMLLQRSRKMCIKAEDEQLMDTNQARNDVQVKQLNFEALVCVLKLK
jgi:hypothetical protein